MNFHLDWQNRGPLTTIFTPSPTCSSNFAYIPDRYTTIVFANSNSRECYPTATFTTRPAETFVDFQHEYYSPGICPSGWYSAADYATKYHGLPTLKPSESVAICCPTGYTAEFASLTTPDPRTSTGSCLSVLGGPVVAQFCAGCTNTSPSPTLIQMTDRNGHAVTARETTLMIRWQPSDESRLAKAYDPPSKGLSREQKIEIGVGVTFGLLFLAGLVGMFIFVRHRRAPVRARAAAERGEVDGVPGESGAKKDQLPIEPMAAAHLRDNRSDGLGGNEMHSGMDSTAPQYENYPLPDTEPPPYTAQGLEDTASAPAVHGHHGNMPSVIGTGPVPSGNAKDEGSRLREQERVLNAQRASLRETLRLLEEDERLRGEQDALRRRIAELDKESPSS